MTLPSIAEVLRMPELRRGEPVVLAGERELGRRVRWVHAAELADIAPLLRGGELLLVTGIALPSDGLARYVRELSGAGVAGLVVELGRRWTSDLPGSLVETCERVGLPLVALRREIGFVTVIQAVGESIVDAQVVELRAAEQIHDTFTALTVAEAGPAEILTEVVKGSGLPVVLESFHHQVLAHNAAGRSAPELLRDWAARSRRVTPPSRTHFDAREGWLVTVVGSRGDDWGRLVLLTPRPPAHRHVVLIERAAAALALHRLHGRHRDTMEQQVHHALLTTLRDQPVDDELLQRCAGAGVPLDRGPLVGLAARPVVARDRGASSVADLIVETAAGLAAALRARRQPALVAPDADDVLALLALPAGVDVDRLLTALVAEVPGGSEVRFGVGEVARRPEAAGRTLAEAQQVAASLRASDPVRPYHRLADVHLRGLLHLLGEDDRVDRFVQREVGALLDYDDEHGTALYDTLRAALTSVNKAAAASALHLSRPALYERLARIERILQVDLDDPESRTSLHVALLAARGRG
ncbi:PucR family transcriptional regulator [Pseudonocardia acaciae]|uniref:PucR family transcriptional regulator n=1 Tax=Pseudonocardia acaciae TaxID=551276 RepID=UPI00048ADD69|nr:PucR family transcriptional regulator ligand-binding domain-containing protein [Pseudonocardia acaciae]